MIMTSREPEPIAHNASHSGLHKTPSIDSSSPTTQLLQRSNNGSTRSTGSTRSNVKCARRDNGESDSDSPTVGLKNSRSTLPQDAMVPEELPPALALLGDTPILQDMIMSRDVGDLRRSRGSDDNGSPNQSPGRNQSGTASPITANLKKPDDSVNVNVINNLMPSSRKRARSDCRSQENSGAVTPTEVTVTQLMPMAAADDQSQSQSQSQNQTLELQDPPGPSRHIFLTVNQTNVSELELSEKLAAVSQVDENGNRKKRRRHRRNHSSHSCQSCQKKGHRRKESKNSYKESSPNKAARGRTEEGVRTKQILGPRKMRFLKNLRKKNFSTVLDLL